MRTFYFKHEVRIIALMAFVTVLVSLFGIVATGKAATLDNGYDAASKDMLSNVQNAAAGLPSTSTRLEEDELDEILGPTIGPTLDRYYKIRGRRNVDYGLTNCHRVSNSSFGCWYAVGVDGTFHVLCKGYVQIWKKNGAVMARITRPCH